MKILYIIIMWNRRTVKSFIIESLQYELQYLSNKYEVKEYLDILGDYEY